MKPVILSGGSGTRLWPLSRGQYPKQFLPLYSKHSLLQDTIMRLSDIGYESPMLICNHETRFMVAEHVQQINIKPSHIVLEPVGRNTAPAIAVAALLAREAEDDPVLMVLPCDHVIQNTKAFAEAAKKAKALAEKGYLVTFGIVPTKPTSEYGYIESGENISQNTYRIANFKEKPSEAVAKTFIEQGNYYWNSGMFVFKASVFLKELEKFHPHMIVHANAAIEKAASDLDFFRLDEEAFKACESISIDYAVMEKTDKAAIVTLDADWSDIGAWSSLWEISPKDAQGNVTNGDVVLENCQNNYFYSDGRLVSAIGIENTIVVDTKDALLIADKTKGNVRKIVDKLKEKKREEITNHRVVYRPWGCYDSICHGVRDKVKRITVKPHAKLSTQLHHHRAEHWVVVKGTAEIRRGDEITMLHENESVYIPKETIHYLANPTDEPLEIIEVQTGEYLAEDDIVRLEDRYGRD